MSFRQMPSLLLAGVVVAFWTAGLSAAEEGEAAKPKPPANSARAAGPRLPAHYAETVTAEQRDKIAAIQTDYAPRIKALQAELKTLVAKRNTAIDELLSPEQLQKIADLKAAAKARAQARRAKQ